jgi:hypothetical protein
MAILGFLGAVAAQLLDPIALVAGIFLGYLFHADFAKLAWGLLLFIVPGIGSLQAPKGAHGVLYDAAAQFLAVCVLAGLSYWFFEYRRTRKRRRP